MFTLDQTETLCSGVIAAREAALVGEVTPLFSELPISTVREIVADAMLADLNVEYDAIVSRLSALTADPYFSSVAFFARCFDGIRGAS